MEGLKREPLDYKDTRSQVDLVRKQTPPYCCPICKKLYRSLSGIEYHITVVGHDEHGNEKTKSNNKFNSTPKKTVVSRSKQRKSGGLKTPRSSSPAPAKRETLTYSEAQRLVQVDVDGGLRRIPMSDDLRVVIGDAPEPKEETKEEVGEQNGGELERGCYGTVDSPSIGGDGLKAVAPLPEIEEEERSEHPDVDSESKEVSDSGRLDAYRKMPKRACTEKGDERNADEGSRVKEAVRKNSRRTATSGAATSALPVAVVRTIEPPCAPVGHTQPSSYYRFIEKSMEEMDEQVEYDMDEEDCGWLHDVNDERKGENAGPVSQEVFEMLMDRLEKESFFESRRAGGTGPEAGLIDEDAVCCICNDGEVQNSNAILFCDMCNLAVHQECYGVPYIPEGQWLCRRCLNSPSCPVDCALCPNAGGAFKQTENGQWAHVVCALWIPEVQFSNAVFLEPVDCIEEIPAARWRLTCYICRRRQGACIQCVKNNCYTAFHATCAQHAGLYMKIEAQRRQDGMPSVRKVVYCDSHSPGGDAADDESDSSSVGKVVVSKSKSSKVAPSSLLHRKLQAERRLSAMAAAPIVNIPFVADHKLSEIGMLAPMQRKGQFMQRLRSFWALKRQSRSGVALLRRLQASHQSQRSGLETETVAALKEQLVHWQRLRHDLERSRLLVELIRKREKLKREEIRINQHVTDLKLQPLTVLLRRTLEQLQQKDPANIFAHPVCVQEVPDYLDIIKQPMDFSTMRKKIEMHEYSSVGDFSADFQLIYENCMTYNARETVYYRAAVRLRDSGATLLRFARKQVERAGIDSQTGMHTDELPENSLRLSVGQGWPLAEQLEDLREELEEVKQSSQPGKVARIKTIQKMMASIRRQMNKKVIDRKVEAGVMTVEEGDAMVNNTPGHRKRRKRQSVTPRKANRRSLNHTSPAVHAAKAALFEDNDDNEVPRNGLLDAQLASRPHRRRRPSERLLESDDQTLRTACINRTLSQESVLSECNPPGSVSRSLSTESVSSSYSGRNVVVSLPRLRGNSITSDGTPSNIDQPANGTVLERNVSEHTLSGRSISRQDRFSIDTIGSDDAFDVDGTITDSIGRVRRGRKSTGSRRRSVIEQIHERLGLSSESTSLCLNSDGDNNMDSGDEGGELQPLDLVWAKCRGYPSYPALIVDPQMPPEGQNQNGVPIPCPTRDVLQLPRSAEDNFLVLFFDNRRTWQWLPRSKLAPLGMDNSLDESKICEAKKSSVRRSVTKAFEKAIIHRLRVSGEDIPEIENDEAIEPSNAVHNEVQV